MQRNHIGKTLAFGIIILFMGVGIHPAFAVDTRQSIINEASENECWDCKEFDSRYFVILERQLKRIEVYTQFLLVISRYNPEIKEKYEGLINELTALRERFEGLISYRVPFICDTIELLIEVLWGIAYHYVSKVFNEDLPNIIEYIYIAIAAVIMFIAEPFVILGEVFDCNIY